MRNNLTGIIISALIHAALFSWAFAVKTDPVKPHTSDNIALTVKMFQEVTSTPTPVVKKLVKKVTPPTPLNPEFADLPPPLKEKLEPKQDIPEPIKVTETKPEILPLPELATLEPVLELIKPEPKKKLKPKIIKKVVEKKKTTPVKTIIKIAKKKVVKKKIIRQKSKRNFVRKKPKAIKKKVISKAKHHQKIAKYTAKRTNTLPKSIKSGGVYSKDKLRKQQLARQRALVAKRAAINRKQSKQTTLKKAPSVVTVNAGVNTTLTQQYKVRLQQLIASNKHYPKRAKRRKQQGKVTVSFRIRHSGIITDICIIKGSKHKG